MRRPKPTIGSTMPDEGIDHAQVPVVVPIYLSETHLVLSYLMNVEME